MGFTVLIPQNVSDVGKNYLTDHGYAIKMGTGIDIPTLVREVADCDAVLVRVAPMSREVLAAGKKLQVVARHGVGYDNVDTKAAAELGIWATNAPLSNAMSVAEHTMMLILATGKNLYAIGEKFREGDFDIRLRVRNVDLEGKTLGLVGVGRIGTMVGKKAALGFDMKVLGYDPYLPADKRIPEIEMTDDLEKVFKTADFISLHIPATPETKGMIGKKYFSLMKKTSLFINCARGEVVNEADLIEALKSGTIAGAGLDVFELEPPAPDNPLLAMSNVVVSPHCASLTAESSDRMALHAAMEIDAVLSGRKPQWPVNKPVGK